jgi:hypothetical protein
MQFGAHLVTKQHDTSLIPNDLQMGYPATTILFIDSHEDARQYFVQRLTISSPDYVVLEADTGAAGLSFANRAVSIALSLTWTCLTCPVSMYSVL